MSGIRDYAPRHTFTPDDDATILRLIGEGRTYREIGREINRNSGSVGVRLARLRAAAAGLGKVKAKTKPVRPGPSRHVLPGQPPPAARERVCLCCSRPFFSQGAHNRLCMTCRGKSISPYAIA